MDRDDRPLRRRATSESSGGWLFVALGVFLLIGGGARMGGLGGGRVSALASLEPWALLQLSVVLAGFLVLAWAWWRS